MKASNAQNPEVRRFTVWKTVTIGTYKDPIALKSALWSAHCLISDGADRMLQSPGFALATNRVSIKLTKVRVMDLGFQETECRDAIYAKAQQLGLCLCPAEIGPQLRLQYLKQRKGEELLVAMNPLPGEDGRDSLFSVDNDDGQLRLGWNHANEEDYWEERACFLWALTHS